ncbi:MAG TPA: extracellular solute-binding protein, partial [Actinobacteria bacterium]|nr:extracellular solute-binding protein [Actinomycetota bacterium]
ERRFLPLTVLGVVFALVAAACSGGDAGDTTVETVIVEVPGETVTSIVEVEVEVPAEGELVTLVARCRAKPPIEDGRCNNLLRGVVDANAALSAAGDSRRVEVKIIQDNPDAGDYVTEFELASAAGEAPDIIAAGHVNIGTWGASGIIADLTDMLGDFPEFDDVIDSLWSSTELNGRRYGVPQDAEARPLYFRKDLLAELGWAQEDIDSLPARLASGEFTWEDMFDTAEEAVNAGVVDPGFGWWPRPKNGPDFLYFYYAAGGEILDDSGALIYDQAAAQKVYEIVGDAVDRDIMVDTRLDGDWGSWHNGVALGSVLFWYAGSWQWAEWAELFVSDLGGEEYLFENVGFGPIPALAGGTNTPITLTQPFSYMVSSATENVDLALLVISKATTTELNTEYAVTSGKLAILDSQADYEPYTSARFQSEMAPILEFTTFQPNSPFFSSWSEAYYLGIEAVVSGELTPEEAVEVVVDILDNELGDDVIVR